MWTLARYLLAVLVLPFTVTILVPSWIARANGVSLRPPASLLEGALLAAGLALLATGLALFSASLYWFATAGRGTLAPWDPPRRLVVCGPYRRVRNPMISGVVLILFGEAGLLRSPPHALWAAVFAAFNLVFIPLLEEPWLEARFGDDYRRYRRHVPRFVPRLRAWKEGE